MATTFFVIVHLSTAVSNRRVHRKINDGYKRMYRFYITNTEYEAGGRLSVSMERCHNGAHVQLCTIEIVLALSASVKKR